MAKRFVFRLDTVQRVRELHEREARRNLAAKQAEIALLDRQNRDTAREISTQQAAMLASQKDARLDLSGLARGRSWIAHLRTTILQREAQKASLMQELQQLQDVWQAARKEVRVLEKLRERRWEAWKRAQRKYEQAATDEVARRLHATQTE
ncbi:MAG: flagellar FliJ family protein [Phycisphaerae bacterium]|nr:flagellar FliJ family protein [Phycisphaerae bacterium]